MSEDRKTIDSELLDVEAKIETIEGFQQRLAELFEAQSQNSNGDYWVNTEAVTSLLRTYYEGVQKQIELIKLKQGM